MENEGQKNDKESCCESSGKGCGCGKGCCAGKAAFALVLLLIGGIIGYFMGHCHACRMMRCSMGMSAPVTTPVNAALSRFMDSFSQSA